jgi:glyoxylase-like metal-dependent hydrolase (beta-lactamase superfamily II)
MTGFRHDTNIFGMSEMCSLLFSRKRKWHRLLIGLLSVHWSRNLEMTKLSLLFVGIFLLCGSVARAQTRKPEWCEPLPRPEYKSLERVSVSDPWFEVYRVTTGVFAIYEPHQFEETIAYLILGSNKALLFDTGMGISDIQKVVSELTALPILVLNSHTHDDHVGGNWRFDDVLGMDTDFTRVNAKGSREDAQAEIAPGEICGELPAGFDAKAYSTKPWKISRFVHDGDKIDLGGRMLEIIATPGHTPDALALLDRANGLLFTGDTYYPAPIWLYRPETDFDAYAASIQKLAALQPLVKIVLGAHNIPVARPSVLPKLVEAFAKVRAGKASCQPVNSTQRECTAYNISFLLPPNPPVVHSQ